MRRTCPAAGITRVILRADGAADAKVLTRPGDTVEVSGHPSGGAQGYHSSDPNWKETPASEWGLDFVCKAYGSTLVVSSKNEIHYIHDSYWLAAITVAVPPGVDVARERRTLSGNGAPDLQPPRKSGQ